MMIRLFSNSVAKKSEALMSDLLKSKASTAPTRVEAASKTVDAHEDMYLSTAGTTDFGLFVKNTAAKVEAAAAERTVGHLGASW